MLEWGPHSNGRRSEVRRLTEKGGFFRIVLLIATVVAGRDTDMLAEDLTQVRLAGKATIRSNIDNAFSRPFQESPERGRSDA